jgi:hypothetical protein
MHEGRISSHICSHCANYLSTRMTLIYFSNKIATTFDLVNKIQPINWCSIVFTEMLVKLTK